MKKSLKKFLAVIIVLSMVFTSHAFVTFAENFENVSNEMELEKEKDESFDVESEVENDNDEEGASETRPYSEVSEENVGASSTSPEDETSEENVGASSTSPEEIVEPEAEEPEEDETDYPEEPEEDETEATVEASEVVVGASSTSPEEDEIDDLVGASSTSPEEETSNSEETAETEIEVENDDLAAVETNTENKLYGATPHKFIIVGKDNDDAGTTKKFTVDDTIENYGVWGNGWNNSGLVTGGEKHGKRGFYTIAQGDSLDEDAVVSSWDETHAIDPDPNAKYNSYVQYKFEEWFDNPTYDIAFGYLFGDEPAPTPTTYTIKYDKNLPSGYTISTSKTWYTDSTSDDLSSNPIKISGSVGMTCENADGYVRKLETWNTLADKSGTPHMFAENINSPAAFTSNPLTLYAIWSDPVAPSTATDKFYIISYGNPTEYPNEKKIFAFDSTTTVEEMENFVANNISKCINPSGKAANGFYNMEELIPVGADDTQVRQILNNNYDLTKEKIRTLDKIAVWFEDYIPDPMGVYLGITFEGSTPPGPTPPTPGGGQSGGNSNGKNNGGDSSSDSGDASPTEGPMGDLTKDPEYADKLVNRDVNTENNIPQSSLLKNDALVTMLKSLPENSSTPYTNAKDQYGNTGFGQWLNVPGTTTWYFNTGNLNGNSGLLRNGWYNLGWRGVDEWYHFDSNGVMDIGWYEEDGKTYYLLYDFSNHWYGKVVTGTQVINGQVYNFDSNGVLII